MDEDAKAVIIWRKYDDGYLVRSMTLGDARIVQQWYLGLGAVSQEELDTCLEVFPTGPGFYIGEKDGEVVASAIRIPWGSGIYFGSYYYVDERHRGKGYGTRLRDEVALEHVGNGVLCIDAVFDGNVVEKNRTKFGYTSAFLTTRYVGPAKEPAGISCDAKIVPASEVSFDDIMRFDSKHFVCADSPMRKSFMRKWVYLPGGATYVALDVEGNITGLCCRRGAMTPNEHQIGPLYAESPDIAETLLSRSCRDVLGKTINIYCWSPNEAVPKMIDKFGLSKSFDLQRMHLNGNPQEYKDTVFGVTSIDVCGF